MSEAIACHEAREIPTLSALHYIGLQAQLSWSSGGCGLLSASR